MTPCVTCRDHPRSCGKDEFDYDALRDMQGSPPLVRERLATSSGATIRRRITPARAGKTSMNTSWKTRSRDHPRSCGKDDLRCFLFSFCGGSPPLVRERLDHQGPQRLDAGITPARAGKTTLVLLRLCKKLDHPRSCGKDHKLPGTLCVLPGSPPLVRERHDGCLPVSYV